ncbi:MAG: histidine phosphatase family protein [Clostridia bacterium]|nr:histidine phosphatase family protein [Clostridia bacterium]
MLLYYIRHGDPIYNPDSLTPLGNEQARALGKRLATYGIDEIYSSDSVRAMQTAQPTCDLLKKEKVLLPWANEGRAWEQLTVVREDGRRTWCFHTQSCVELFNSPEVLAMGEAWYDHPCFADTSFKQGIERIDREADGFLLSLGYRHDRVNHRYEAVTPNDKRIALFAHQGFGLAFLGSILDVPYPYFATHFDLSHSSMSVINFSGTGDWIYPKALQLSNDSHLYRDGLLTGYNNGIRV